MLSYDERKKLKIEVEKTIEIIETAEEKARLGMIISNLLDDNNDNVYKSYDVLYHNATEDIATYYQEYRNPEKFLTVGASGDQLLNAVAIGATKIDVFDTNCLSKRGCALKVAGAKSLTPTELQNYFTDFDEEVYRHLSLNLSESDLIFWDSIYDFVGEESIRYLFPYKRLDCDLIRRINPYLDENSYNEFQEKLKRVEINYIDSSLYELPNHLGTNTYDGMCFSNIYEYINGNKVNKDTAHQFYNFIMTNMYPRLNDNGTMMFAYIYAFNDKVKKEFDDMYDKNIEDLVKSEIINFNQLLYYNMGLTLQNYSYSLLLDEFANEYISKVVTEHVEYGQSIDMSHDMALCLHKIK